MEAQLLLLVVCAAVQTWAKCPTMSYVDTLDLEQFMGTWYQYASFGTLFVHGLDRCVKSKYSLDSDGETITMANDRIANKVNQHVATTWTAVAEGSDGKLSLTLNVPVLGEITVPLFVLGTDDNYAVLYTCKKIALVTFKAGWIFTREKEYSEDELAPILTEVDEVLEKNKLKRSKFGVTSQEDCDSASGGLDVVQLAAVAGVVAKVAG